MTVFAPFSMDWMPQGGSRFPNDSAGPAATDRRHQLAAQRRIGLEIAEPAFGDHRRLALIDAARAHAAVPRLDDHGNALGLQHRLEGAGDLDGQPLLELEAAGEGVDEARELRDADDAP